MAEMGYEYHKLDTPSEDELELQHLTPIPSDPATEEELGPKTITHKLHPYKHPIRTRVFVVIMYVLLMSLLAGAVAVVRSAVVEKPATSTSSSSTQVPQYFQTTPEIYAGTHSFQSS